jgi:hypothetical protein
LLPVGKTYLEVTDPFLNRDSAATPLRENLKPHPRFSVHCQGFPASLVCQPDQSCIDADTGFHISEHSSKAKKRITLCKKGIGTMDRRVFVGMGQGREKARGQLCGFSDTISLS